MTINFSKIAIKDIEGNERFMDISKDLGNNLYMYGKNIVECELGKKIYFSEGDIELTDEEKSCVVGKIAGYPYILQESLKELLK